MRARDVMSTEPNCCTPSSSARTAAALMAKFNLGALPVIDSYSRRTLVGIVTDRDLCVHAVAERGERPIRLVRDCMTTNPICCGPQTKLRQVVAAMMEHKVHRVPIVDRRHRLVGIVSTTDLLQAGAIAFGELPRTRSAISTKPDEAAVSIAMASYLPLRMPVPSFLDCERPQAPAHVPTPSATHARTVTDHRSSLNSSR